MINCKDFTREELHKKFPNGKNVLYYVSEIEAYVNRASVNNPATNWLPPCPFSKVEMMKNRIQYEFININEGITDEHLEIMNNFKNNPNKKTMFMVILDEEDMSEEEGVKLAGRLTRKFNRHYAEDTDPDELVALISNWKADREVDVYVNAPQFLFFLVQWVGDLDEGNKKLEQLGYYDKLSPDQFIADDTQKGSHPILAKRVDRVVTESDKQNNVEIDFYDKNSK